jgi:1,4-dihydroxy-2-naphthoate polyprenyltransferase
MEMTNRWVAGARLRTLPASIVPVFVGTACAVSERHAFGAPQSIVWWRFVAAVVVALALQIATNYANDYSDGIRGTDDVRVGPVRLVASKLASPKAVKMAAFAAFGVAGVTGGALALAVGPELFAVGALSMLAGWFYTGGPKPYGYLGLGEVFVFVFFGLVATMGSTYVQLERVTTLSAVAGVAMGCLSCALLVVNNLRDIPTDTKAGKRTLAVRFGDPGTRLFYVGLIVVAFAAAVASGAWRVGALAALVAVVAAVPPTRVVKSGAKGRELIAALAGTGRLQLVFGVTYAIGLALSHTR